MYTAARFCDHLMNSAGISGYRALYINVEGELAGTTQICREVVFKVRPEPGAAAEENPGESS